MGILGRNGTCGLLSSAVLLLAAWVPKALAIQLRAQNETAEVGTGTNTSSRGAVALPFNGYGMGNGDFETSFKPRENTCSDLEDTGLEIVYLGGADEWAPLTPNKLPPSTPTSTSPAPLQPEDGNTTGVPPTWDVLTPNEPTAELPPDAPPTPHATLPAAPPSATLDARSIVTSGEVPPANATPPNASGFEDSNSTKAVRGIDGEPDDYTEFRKPMIWLHIHKAAGSTMCTLAKLNDEVPIEFGKSACMWLNADFWFPIPNFTGYPGEPSCQDRLDFLDYEKGRGTDGRAVTWLQIERPFLAQDFCPSLFRYGVMLRDPLRLAESMTNFKIDWEGAEGPRYKEILACLKTQNSNLTSPCDELVSHSQHLYSLRLWLYYDNLMVRVLDGMNTYRLPPGQVKSENVYRVIELLKKFDIVTLLEDLQSDVTASTFQAAFGWRYAVAPRVNAFAGEYGQYDIQFSSEETVYLKERLKYDYALYWYFKRAKQAPVKTFHLQRLGYNGLSCEESTARADASR